MIKLTKFISEDQNIPNQQAWSLSVVAEAESGATLPSDIFVYQAGSNNPLDPESGDRFRCIASVHDIYEFGTTISAGTTVDSEFVPYYRKNRVDLIFRTPEEVDEVWAKIVRDTEDLVQSWKLIEQLSQVEEVTIV